MSGAVSSREVAAGVQDRARQVLRCLRRFYGEPSLERKHTDAMAELIQTILSQNTSDLNSDRAYEALKRRFPTWQELLRAQTEEIADAVRIGGLAEIKASRIKEVLGEIERRFGVLSLDQLRTWDLEGARRFLTSLPGVGPKTAACVLLFSLEKPAMPVDTHVYRVSRRLGLIDRRMPAHRAHLVLESLVRPEEVYSFHMLLIRHGRQTCKAQKPRCSECPLAGLCPKVGVEAPSLGPPGHAPAS